MWCFALTSCNPNTGHSLATNDSLEIDDSEDWTPTWTLEAPKVTRGIEDRISEAQLHYTIDSGVWQSAPLLATKETDTRIQLVATIDRAQLTGHRRIQCFTEYVFDGTQEGGHGRKDPRVIQINKKDASLDSAKQLVTAYKAREQHNRLYFSYPDTLIRITLGTGRSVAIPFKNHSVPRSIDELPVFHSGWGASGDRPDNPSVLWRFLQRTGFGDVYLIDVEKNEILLKAFPVLYTGSKVIAYDHDDISVVFEPSHPQAK